jgi:serine phosphatase RsbU (regulator of sigma subunit)
MAAGDTLLMYTDGLVERRDQPLQTGLTRLHHTLATLADTTLDHLCDTLLTRLLPADPQDDVALIAARLTYPPGDPRP